MTKIFHVKIITCALLTTLLVPFDLLAQYYDAAGDAYFKAKAEATLILPQGHVDEITALLMTPNGKQVISGGHDGSVKVWDVATGNELRTQSLFDGPIVGMSMSPDGKHYLVTGGGMMDLTIVYGDLYTYLGQVFVIGKDTLLGELPNDAVFSKDGMSIVSAQNKERISLKTKTKIPFGEPQASKLNKSKYYGYGRGRDMGGKLISAYDIDSVRKLFGQVTCIYISDNDSFLLLGDPDGTIRLLRRSDGHLIQEFKGKTAPCDLIVKHPIDNKKMAIYHSYGGAVYILTLKPGEKMKRLQHRKRVMDAAFSPDGKFLMTREDEGPVRIWDAVSGLEYLNFNHIDTSFNMYYYRRDSTLLIMSNNSLKDGRYHALVADPQTGATRLAEEKDYYKSGYANYRGNKEFIRTLGGLRTSPYLNACNQYSGRGIGHFIPFKDGNWIIICNDGYYMDSKLDKDFLGFNMKGKIISYRQLDVKYNRPDTVLERMGWSDSVLIQYYKKAYYKRIEKLGIDPASFGTGFSMPEADIDNNENIKYEQVNDQLLLHITGKDPSHSLSRFNVWVNECPIYGVRGISTKNKKFFDTVITVTLSEGKNMIEASIIDINGIESYRKPLYINYTPPKPVKETVWFIGIGIDSFADASYNLKWCSSDIQNLARDLKSKYGEALQTKLLLNKDVTTRNITSLKSYLQDNTAINDKVIIAYAGHGLFSQNFDYYLSTYGVKFSNPEEQGVPYDLVESLLDGIPARKKLLLLDACYSGEIDKQELKRLEEVADAIAKRGGKVISYDTTSKRVSGTNSSFILMQELFVNAARNTGATVISAAGGTQFALERGDLKGGVFTYSILEALKQYPHFSVSNLRDHINKRVTELTGGVQVPTTRSEARNNDWEVW